MFIVFNFIHINIDGSPMPSYLALNFTCFDIHRLDPPPFPYCWIGLCIYLDGRVRHNILAFKPDHTAFRLLLCIWLSFYAQFLSRVLFCKKRTLLFCGIVLAMRDKRENADQLISFNVLSQQLINFQCKFLCGESFHLLGYIKN